MCGVVLCAVLMCMNIEQGNGTWTGFIFSDIMNREKQRAGCPRQAEHGDMEICCESIVPGEIIRQRFKRKRDYDHALELCASCWHGCPLYRLMDVREPEKQTSKGDVWRYE